MKITVTREDITNGQKCSTNRCPIALAATRATRHHVIVSTSYIMLPGIEVPLPNSACTFIGEFDSGRTVEPFEFEVAT